ncbi:MAG: alcohol dehydrogenase catalytic domain-containing protein [Actinobacteria bacterium]|nr:alcohol dehydrogenase catalytic domain-containing protein [Actinomycetota bacterium]
MAKVKPEFGIEVIDLPIPQPKADEILIKVKNAGICGSDVHIYEWTSGYEYMAGLLPLVIGHEFAGEVMEVGSAVKSVTAGDHVTAIPHVNCKSCYFCRRGLIQLCDWGCGKADVAKEVPKAMQIGFRRNGGMAEYIAIPEGNVYKLPPEMPFDIGAMVNPISVGFHCVEKTYVCGEVVCVLGPGPIGLSCVISAKAAGAAKVIVAGLGKDIRRLDIARQVGADEAMVVDEVDIVAAVMQITGGLGAAVVFETTGVPDILSQAVKMTRKNGEVFLSGIYARESQFQFSDLVRGQIALRGSYSMLPASYDRVISLMAVGRIDPRPLVTRKMNIQEAQTAFELLRNKEEVKIQFQF